MCIHRNHALVSVYPTTYSRQSCRSCLLSHYAPKTPKPPQHPKPASSSHPTDRPSTDVVTLHTQHGQCRDGNDVRPGEVPEFLSEISTTPDALLKHRATWEKKENGEEAEETDVEMDDCPTKMPLTVSSSLTDDHRKDEAFSNGLLKDREKLDRLSLEQFYKTTTQKLYEGADWSVFLKPKPKPPLHTKDLGTNCQINKLQWKNAPLGKSEMLPGQRSWDSYQYRSNEGKENQTLSFTTSSRKIQQIPNYSGTISGFGEKDMNIYSFQPLSCVRTSKPRYIETSRKPHIPGYAGFTSTYRAKEVFTAEPQPRAESTAASFSRLGGYEAEFSTFRHRSPLSKTVTKVHPFNPFNRVNYALNRTVGENSV